MIVFKASAQPIAALAFSLDGARLAVCDNHGHAYVWAAPYESPLAVSESPRSLELGLAFSPDGNLLACVGYYSIVVVDLATGAPVLSLQEGANRCRFSPDGKVFVSQGQDKPLRRWDASSWKELPGGWGGSRSSTDRKQFPLCPLAYHPDGSVLAAGFAVSGSRGYDSAVFLWDANTGKELGRLVSAHASAHPTEIVFSPEGRFLAGVYGPHLRIWDVAARAEVAHRQVGRKHFQGVAFTPDGGRVVTVSNDETVRLWAAPTWAEVEGFSWKIGKLRCVAVSPDGMRMAAGGDRGKVVVWDVD